MHEHIDFQDIKPLSEEVYTDLIGGETRRLDIAVETKLKHTDVLVIVHIAAFSYENNWENNRYIMEFLFSHVLTFDYLTLHLQKQNWRDFIKSDNRVVAALLCEMGYEKREKI